MHVIVVLVSLLVFVLCLRRTTEHQTRTIVCFKKQKQSAMWPSLKTNDC